MLDVLTAENQQLRSNGDLPLTDAGGKDKANIHLDTKDVGSLTIRTDKEYLAGYQGNPLYKKMVYEFGLRRIFLQAI